MRTPSMILLAAVALAGGCTHTEAFLDAQREIESQDLVIDQLTRRNEELLVRESALQGELDTARAENEGMRQQHASLGSGLAEADQRIRAAEGRYEALAAQLGQLGGGIRGVTVKAHPDGVALEVAETLLFPLGKAQLSPDGKTLLSQLAGRLAARSETIRVEGHTDDTPVVRTRDQFPRGNLELSGERALVVAAYLVHEGGLPAGRVAFAGFGEHRPVVANSTVENKARNRRVEIVLLPADR